MSEQDIFVEAISRPDTAERRRFLDQACGDDEALRARMEKLIRHSDGLGSFLEHPPEPLTITANAMIDAEVIGTQIGPYRIREQLGEGGFGTVFLAEQERPIRRRVALKIIKPGMDTREVIARFEAERQTLALMDHPNIAKVYEAGTTEIGRPYFVMELVQGVPITEYCDQCNLTTKERLELFVTVCQAVQHAHQKGVIHRDIKPTNVLVAMQDGRPVPKIIDFGVAKAINQQLTDRTLMTAYAQMVGTPLYMSPEQAELSPLGVDTRSDIYSLGVLLYELLAGTTPFEKDRLHAASYDELRRIIREEEPPPPSARISTLAADVAATVADHRRTEARRLRQTVRGELDWIVMKCLEKDRNRRYESAGSLAGDIERYLHDEPVQACPPSTMYRLSKYARRNKVALAFVTLLIAGLTYLAYSNVAIRRERDAKTTALAQAKTETARAKAVSDLLQEMLGSSYPDRVKNSQYTVRELLDDFSAGLEDPLEGQPEVEAAIRSMIGRSYGGLQVPDRAELHLKQALDLNRQVFGASDEHVANSLVDYAWNLGAQSRYAEAEACVREAASIYQKLDSNPQVSSSLANALYLMALAQLRLGDKAGYRATCKALVDLPVQSWDDVLRSRPIWPVCLAPSALDDMSRLVKRAEEFVAGTSLKNRHFGLYVLGAALFRAGDYERAAQQLEEAIDAYPNVPEFGRDTINYQTLLLAMTRWNQGREDEARKLLTKAQSAVDKELQFSSTNWGRRTSLELLLAEAQALIKPKQADKTVEKVEPKQSAPTTDN
jgi:serine/threonine protein kinase